MKYKELKTNFEKRNIEFQYFDNRDELLKVLEDEFRSFNSIGIGNSQTLKILKISEKASQMGKTVYDKTFAKDIDDIKKMKLKALTSECYVSSSNSITLDGKIINIDHSGNRVAAITYGPDRVLIIVGENKIAENENAGVKRALEIATPMNAKRAKVDSQCSKGNGCNNCEQETRVCNYISIIRGQHIKNRMKVLLLNESLGF
jgi:hypothetical protein